MKNKTVSVRVHIPLETLESMLYSARQGTSYWVNDEPNEENEVTGLEFLDYANEVRNFLKGELEIFVFDGEDNDKKYILNIAKLKKGLTVLAKKYFHHISDIMEGNEDMYTTDALIQCALFGDILYS